ncbi:MAG: FAD-dependent oxidoreductase [Burkholderiales bacterium]|nr:MAG: FAD-dependent oxidoreductase [Burkholderiales bacterium]
MNRPVTLDRADAIDMVIVGAGPAGLAAAAAAATRGASVMLLDEQPEPGGQIYRAIERNAARPSAGRQRERLGEMLGPDYRRGARLLEALGRADVQHVRGARVWRVDPDRTVSWSTGASSGEARPRTLVLAAGALERPFPVPGWTLPGVMTVGGAQTLMKASGVVPHAAALVGCGPLLYLFATQLIDAGHPPLALIETQSWSDQLRALPRLPAALRAHRYLTKGLALLQRIRRAGVKRYVGAEQIAIEGGAHVERLRFRAGGRDLAFETDSVLLHVGVVPNIQMSMALRLEHEWYRPQRYWRPRLDAFGRTAAEGVFIAGDGAGIGGAVAAEHRGELAALAALVQLGRVEQGAIAARVESVRRSLEAELAPRAFLDALYPTPAQARQPADATVVCRCEEVTAADVRRYASLGCKGPNQTKAFGRCGMGWCQGRYCGLTVAELLAEANGIEPEQVGYYRIRSPIKPVTLGELAAHAEQGGG